MCEGMRRMGRVNLAGTKNFMAPMSGKNLECHKMEMEAKDKIMLKTQDSLNPFASWRPSAISCNSLLICFPLSSSSSATNLGAKSTTSRTIWLKSVPWSSQRFFGVASSPSLILYEASWKKYFRILHSADDLTTLCKSRFLILSASYFSNDDFD